ncbi:MAG: hypothetical protein NZQ09_15725 [Chloroflexus sp.]|nr:hypothetical protein [Chloroflexus sp.]
MRQQYRIELSRSLYWFVQLFLLHRSCLLLITLILAGLFLSACTPSPIQPTSLSFERSGGFVGLADRLTIDLNTGSARLQHGKEIIATTIDAEQRAQLRALIAELDLARLTDTPPPPNQCCDFLNYRIQIDAVTIQTTDANLPASLQPLVTELDAIITGMISR